MNTRKTIENPFTIPAETVEIGDYNITITFQQGRDGKGHVKLGFKYDNGSRSERNTPLSETALANTMLINRTDRDIATFVDGLNANNFDVATALYPTNLDAINQNSGGALLTPKDEIGVVNLTMPVGFPAKAFIDSVKDTLRITYAKAPPGYEPVNQQYKNTVDARGHRRVQ